MNAPLNILVIESNNAYKEYLEDCIKKNLNARLIFVNNKEQVSLQLLNFPSLVLLDGDLPKNSSDSILKWIREKPEYNNIPIIWLSKSQSEGSHILHALESGADDFIEKDAPKGVILSRIKTQIRHRSAKKKLEVMATDRDLFAAGILHDIKNIETTIRAVCEYTVMQIKKDPEKRKDQVKHNIELLMQAAAKLSRYADDVISSVRLSDQMVQNEAVHIEQILEWCQDLLSNPQIYSAEKSLTLNFQGNLSPVHADPNFLRLAIFNIVQNALKYSSSPNVHLDIYQKHSSDDDTITTYIRDHGPGLEEIKLDQIFQPFKRGRRTDDSKGFGLGLSMVYNVIHKLSGKVWAEQPDEGTGLVIVIRLPRKKTKKV